MTALPTRILRTVVERMPITHQALMAAYPAYTERARRVAIERLLRAHLIDSPYAGIVVATDLGRTTAASPVPPRWSAPRRSSPRTATIAR